MKTRSKIIRILAASGVLALAVAAAHLGGGAAVGTLCVLCPVGFAQVAAASQSIPWALLPGVLAVLAIVFLLGRAFCSWACPSQLLKNIFGGHTPRGILGRSGKAPASAAGGAPAAGEAPAADETSGPGETSGEKLAAGEKHAAGKTAAGKTAAAEILPAGEKPVAASGCASCGSSGASLKSQGVVLAVLLVVSFAVGFPVFCLLCPIGLVFGTLWALNRVFVLLQPGWELVVFPLMLLAELFLFKRWCSAICPLGFFFGLVEKARTKLGFGVRPQANRATCLSGEGCRTCSTACPENIDVAHADARELEACTLCGDCLENCPAQSIKLSFGAPKEASFAGATAPANAAGSADASVPSDDLAKE